MPLQNRVLPTGEIVAHPARGMFTGNRGILHRPDRTLGVSRWTHKHWIICDLEHPKGVHHGPMPHRGWTALFFLDEAVALAAGHRPCAYCRRAAYRRWMEAWSDAHGRAATREEVDHSLHAHRVTRTRKQIVHSAEPMDLPNFTFVLWANRPYMIWLDRLLPFQPEGYGAPIPTRPGQVQVLTPMPTVLTLRAGFEPKVQSSLLA